MGGSCWCPPRFKLAAPGQSPPLFAVAAPFYSLIGVGSQLRLHNGPPRTNHHTRLHITTAFTQCSTSTLAVPQEVVMAAYLDRTDLCAHGFYSTPDVSGFGGDMPFNYFCYGGLLSLWRPCFCV
jgi:hypothetical protein